MRRAILCSLIVLGLAGVASAEWLWHPTKLQLRQGDAVELAPRGYVVADKARWDAARLAPPWHRYDDDGKPGVLSPLLATQATDARLRAQWLSRGVSAEASLLAAKAFRARLVTASKSTVAIDARIVVLEKAATDAVKELP